MSKPKNTTEETGIVPVEVLPQSLIAQAITQHADVATMEKLMDLQDRWDAKQAKKAFDEAMGAFQSECPVIKKSTEGGRTNAGAVVYRYATLEAIVSQTKALLQKHGFSYAIKTASTATEIKAICIVKHKLGHSEESDFAVPSGGGTSLMSAPQKVAAALTFAKRYAFCNAFGIMTGDADNDANIGGTGSSAEKTDAAMKTLLEALKKATHKELKELQTRMIKSDKYTEEQKQEYVFAIEGRLAELKNKEHSE